MTSATALNALADRVEQGSGEDRELDAEVMFDLFAKPVGQKEDGGPSGYLWPEDNPSWSFGIRFTGKDREWLAKTRKHNSGETLAIDRDGALVLMNDLRIPPLTTDLTAVVSLIERVVPAGTNWKLHGTTGDGAAASAHLMQQSGYAWSPERALLAALLRAAAIRWFNHKRAMRYGRAALKDAGWVRA